MRPISSGGQDVGPSGVATGHGAFHLSSSNSGMKKISTDGVSLYYFLMVLHFVKIIAFIGMKVSL
ncbi:hypothetical protein [Rummeliibacillus suwonensis]|uniref:hypothetical protein n=1 Tax=Rummeliibacillus suwonensis TaxID=1306154 RepID=UPI002898DE6A|nr:hypothetical protein [Rummeliibacillus suwonensis]